MVEQTEIRLVPRKWRVNRFARIAFGLWRAGLLHHVSLVGCWRMSAWIEPPKAP